MLGDGGTKLQIHSHVTIYSKTNRNGSYCHFGDGIRTGGNHYCIPQIGGCAMVDAFGLFLLYRTDMGVARHVADQLDDRRQEENLTHIDALTFVLQQGWNAGYQRFHIVD